MDLCHEFLSCMELQMEKADVVFAVFSNLYCCKEERYERRHDGEYDVTIKGKALLC